MAGLGKRLRLCAAYVYSVALKWYHVPQQICELLFRYYDEIFLQVATEDWRSDWFHLAIGVPQGCTASTIMFDVAFQVVIDIC